MLSLLGAARGVETLSLIPARLGVQLSQEHLFILSRWEEKPRPTGSRSAQSPFLPSFRCHEFIVGAINPKVGSEALHSEPFAYSATPLLNPVLSTRSAKTGFCSPRLLAHSLSAFHHLPCSIRLNMRLAYLRWRLKSHLQLWNKMPYVSIVSDMDAREMMGRGDGHPFPG